MEKYVTNILISHYSSIFDDQRAHDEDGTALSCASWCPSSWVMSGKKSYKSGWVRRQQETQSVLQETHLEWVKIALLWLWKFGPFFFTRPAQLSPSHTHTPFPNPMPHYGFKMSTSVKKNKQNIYLQNSPWIPTCVWKRENVCDFPTKKWSSLGCFGVGLTGGPVMGQATIKFNWLL